MWFEWLIVFGACAAGAVAGLVAYKVVTRVARAPRADRTSPALDQAQGTPGPAADRSAEQPADADGLDTLAAYLLEHERGPDFEIPDDLSKPALSDHPEVRVAQDGSLLKISVRPPEKQGAAPSAEVINLTIRMPPGYTVRQGAGPFDIEIVSREEAPESSGREAEPAGEPAGPALGLMDEVTVKPLESPPAVVVGPIDEIPAGPASIMFASGQSLMDEIAVRPAGGVTIAEARPVDEISVARAYEETSSGPVLMDEISVKPPAGPVNIQYELLDDLITSRAGYRTRKGGLSGVVSAATAAGTPSGAAPVSTISAREIAEVLRESPVFKRPARLPAVVAKASRALPTGRTVIGKWTPVGRAARNVAARLTRVAARVLADLRIYDSREYYIRDVDLTRAGAAQPPPQLEGFVFKVVSTPAEFDELTKGGYGCPPGARRVRRQLRKGTVAFLGFAERELAAMGWACTTGESKAACKGYPYVDELDRDVCIVADWANPKFLDSGVPAYVRQQTAKVLKDRGFTVARSVVATGNLKDPGLPVDAGSAVTFKRRTCISASLPGILGVKTWRELPLNETSPQPWESIIISVLPLLLLPCSHDYR